MEITISVTHHPITKWRILSNELDGLFFIPKEFFVLGSFLRLFDALFDWFNYVMMMVQDSLYNVIIYTK